MRSKKEIEFLKWNFFFWKISSTKKNVHLYEFDFIPYIFLCISRKTNVCVRCVWIIKILLLQSIRIKNFFPSFRVKPNFIEAGRYGREMNKKQQRYWLFYLIYFTHAIETKKKWTILFHFVYVYGIDVLYSHIVLEKLSFE